MKINCFISGQIAGLVDDEGTINVKAIRDALEDGLKRAGYQFDAVAIQPITSVITPDAPTQQ